MSLIHHFLERNNHTPGSLIPFWSRSTLLIAGAVMLIIITGTSGLVYHSPFAPLAAVGLITAAVMILLWIQHPVLALYLAIFILLLPLGLIPDQYQSLLNRSITIAALAAWLFSFILKRRYMIYTPSMLAMVAFMLWSSLTLLWTYDLNSSLNTIQIYVMRFILFILLISNEITTKEKLNGLMNVIALNGWVLALAGIFTILTQGYAVGSRLQVFNINENELGVEMMIFTPAVLWQAMQPSRSYGLLKRLMGMLFLLLMMALVALSGSRGSAISLFIILVAFWIWKPTRPWGNFVLVILLLGAVAAPFLFTATIQRFGVQPGDTLLGHREPLWSSGWLLFTQHPLTGVGIGASIKAVLPYIRLFSSLFALSGTALHNPILTILVETGVIGLILYLAIPFLAVWSFISEYFRIKKQGDKTLLLYFALVGSVFLGYLASWIKGGGMESDYTFFLMLSLLLVPFSLSRKELSK